MLPPSREHSGSTAEHGEGSGRTECFPRAENTLGATNPIERSTGPREDARGAETILRIPRPQNLPSFLGDSMAL